MTIYDGRSALLTASVDDSSYATVTQIVSVKHAYKGNNIDVSVLGASFIARNQGLKDMSWSLSGFYAPGDTTGQVRIRTALKNDSALYLKYLPDATTGVKQPVVVDSFDWDGDAAKMVEVSIECSGNGTATDI